MSDAAGLVVGLPLCLLHRPAPRALAPIAPLPSRNALAGELERHTDLSARELALLRRKLAALLAAGGPQLSELDGELDGVLRDVSNASDAQQRAARRGQQQHSGKQPAGRGAAVREQAGSDAAPLSVPGLLAAALEDAESTVALLQAQLVSRNAAAAEAQARVADLQLRLAAAVVRRSREVSSARAAGEVQLAALQEAVQRLGQRSDMAGQVREAAESGGAGLRGCGLPWLVL